MMKSMRMINDLPRSSEFSKDFSKEEELKWSSNSQYKRTDKTPPQKKQLSNHHALIKWLVT